MGGNGKPYFCPGLVNRQQALPAYPATMMSGSRAVKPSFRNGWRRGERVAGLG